LMIRKYVIWSTPARVWLAGVFVERARPGQKKWHGEAFAPRSKRSTAVSRRPFSFDTSEVVVVETLRGAMRDRLTAIVKKNLKYRATKNSLILG